MKTVGLTEIMTDLKIIISHNSDVVRRIGIFGSLVNNTFTDNSDIDVAIEYEPGDKYDFDNFVKFCEICEYISETIFNNYGRKADLIPVEDRSGNLLQDIREEVIWI